MPVNLVSDILVEWNKLTWTPNGGSATVLGLTQEGSKIDIKRGTTKITANELGDTAIDFKGLGWSIEVTAMLLGTTIENLAIALGATLTTVTTAKSVDLDPRAGTSLPYGKLELRPYGMTTGARDWTLYRAQILADNFSADYASNKALAYPVKFTGTIYQDTTSGNVKIATYGIAANAVDYAALL
jgi:hypothetical protein